MTAFVRTLLGDLPADESLGICAAHEHVVMHGEWLNTHFPDFVLDDLDCILLDLREFQRAGGGWIVDSMPTGAGRDAALLERASRLSGVPIVCPTGVHQSKYYPPDHVLLTSSRDQLAQVFHQEITVGINDGGEALPVCAGVIKVASSGPQLTSRDREVLAAAAQVQRELGCTILTHTEASGDALQQVEWLSECRASLAHVVLSHCDKNLDALFHRDLLQSGVRLEYDQHFRQIRRGERCASVDLIAMLIADFPQQILLGMDLARRSYWKGYGGAPGLAWLVTELVSRLHLVGLSAEHMHRILITNAAHTFSFSRGETTRS